MNKLEYLHTFQPFNSEYYTLRKKYLSICQIHEYSAIKDVRTGYMYYQNNVSGESTWDMPIECDLIYKLINLIELKLNNNLLKYLCNSLKYCTKLILLDLSYNRICTLLSGIDALINLQYLYIQFNELIHLPNSIENLINLKILYIHNNNLIKLPERLGYIHTLECVNFSSNYITTIPYSFGYAKCLNELNLEDNPLVDPSVEVAVRPLRELQWVLRQKLIIGKIFYNI